MKTEIDFNKAINGTKEDAEKIVKEIQDLIDTMTKGVEQSKEAADYANNVAEDALTKLKNQIDVTDKLTTAIKDIHLTLSNNSDCWKDNKEIKGMVEGLAVFVVSSGSIKSGIRQESERRK